MTTDTRRAEITALLRTEIAGLALDAPIAADMTADNLIDNGITMEEFEIAHEIAIEVIAALRAEAEETEIEDYAARRDADERGDD